MRLTFDPRYNIAYLSLRDKTAEVETVRVSDELNVDMAPDGTIYGIELLDANRQLRVDRNEALVVTNASSGASSSVKFPV
jgi:uncharacterized protein YuzE